MSRTRNISLGAVLLALGVVLTAAGCVTIGKSGPSQFYVLTSQADEPSESARLDAPRIPVVGVRPPIIPTTLRRPHFVVQTADNEIQIIQTERWGEPLEDGISRAMVENITIMIPSQAVYQLPAPVALEYDYQISLEVFRYGYNGTDAVVLVARWALYDGETGEVVAEESAQYDESMVVDEDNPLDYRKVAGSMSRLLEQLCQEIVVVIQGGAAQS